MAKRTREQASNVDAQAILDRQEAERAMGVERGSATSRRVARGTGRGGIAAKAAKRLARIEREKRRGSRGPFKEKQT
jgi:hypothetical protein